MPSVMMAQGMALDTTETGEVEFVPEGLSGTTAFLYIDLKTGEAGLAEKYGLTHWNGALYVEAFAQMKQDDMDLYDRYGIRFNGSMGKGSCAFPYPWRISPPLWSPVVRNILK